MRDNEKNLKKEDNMKLTLTDDKKEKCQSCAASLLLDPDEPYLIPGYGYDEEESIKNYLANVDKFVSEWQKIQAQLREQYNAGS